MSILANSPDLTKIINKAIKRIGENHALARDNKGVEMKSIEIEEDRKEFRKGRTNEIANETMDSVIEESLKAVADEMAEKMVLENTIDGMVKSTIKEIGGGSGFEKPQGGSDSLKKFNKRQEVGEGEECGAGMYWCNKSEKCMPKEEKTIDESTTDMIKKLVSKKLKNISEDLTRTPVQGRVPGLDVYEKSIKKSKTDTDAHLKATKKKFEDYADFENNSKPEFPHQNNSKTADADGQFQYYRNDDEQEEYIDDNRGMGLQDANGAVDLEKISDYLDGSSTTGNAQVDADGNALGNVTKSDLGKKIEKTAIRKKKKNDDALNSMSNDRRYSPNVQKVKTVKEDVAIDMENMKKLWAYNKKTQ